MKVLGSHSDKIYEEAEQFFCHNCKNSGIPKCDTDDNNVKIVFEYEKAGFSSDTFSIFSCWDPK